MMATSKAIAIFFFGTLICSIFSSTEGLYGGKSSKVVQLTAKNFEKEVVQGSGVWLVEFYAPWCGHCKNLAPEWKKAASALDGVVHVAAVDCDKESSLAGKYGVQGFPTIKVFGQNKKKPTDYQGERTSKAIINAGISEARNLVKSRMNGKNKPRSNTKQEQKKPSKQQKKKPATPESSDDVVVLTDDNFENQVYGSDEVWLVDFYAPWCGHCKQLEPEWEKAASELSGSVRLAKVDATEHKKLASDFGIKGFPTIKVFAPGSNSPSDAEDYQGGRTSSSIVAYALNKLQATGGTVGPKYPEIVSNEVLTKHCKKNYICVLVFLPHILDSQKAGREEYLKIIEETAKSLRGEPFRFGWVQGGDQRDLEEQFGLTFGFPSLVALNLDKERFSVQRGAFTPEGIQKFLNGVKRGNEVSLAMRTPKIKKVEGWDGEDAKLMEHDDEGDDDIMKEILTDTPSKDEL